VSTEPKQRVVVELANGGGVIVEPLCALCGEANQAIECPICKRVLCTEMCFEVHLNARDSADGVDRVDAFLRTEHAYKLLDIALREKDPEWVHGLTCDNCKPQLRVIAMHVLVESVKIAVSEP